MSRTLKLVESRGIAGSRLATVASAARVARVARVARIAEST